MRAMNKTTPHPPTVVAHPAKKSLFTPTPHPPTAIATGGTPAAPAVKTMTPEPEAAPEGQETDEKNT